MVDASEEGEITSDVLLRLPDLKKRKGEKDQGAELSEGNDPDV